MYWNFSQMETDLQLESSKKIGLPKCVRANSNRLKVESEAKPKKGGRRLGEEGRRVKVKETRMRDEATKLGMLEGAVRSEGSRLANAITITACGLGDGGHFSLVEVTQAAGSAVDIDIRIGIGDDNDNDNGNGNGNGNQLLYLCPASRRSPWPAIGRYETGWGGHPTRQSPPSLSRFHIASSPFAPTTLILRCASPHATPRHATPPPSSHRPAAAAARCQ